MLSTPRSQRGMVVSPHHLASQAGLSVLEGGGGALEACVATAAAIAVVYPHMNSIGGDAFWLIAEPDGSVRTIGGAGGAARRADLGLYARAGLSSIPWRGPLAANTVAGAISTWEAALDDVDGPLPLARLLRDAIHYAEAGVVVSAGWAKVAKDKDGELRDQPGYAEIFRPNGRAVIEGEIVRQPALAGALRRLADDGLDSFYRGAMASDIAADLAATGSPVAVEDLAAHQATRPAPLSVKVNGAALYNYPPPTQGISSLMILALFDRLHAAETDGFDHVHGIVEATKAAFALRDHDVGDPAFMRVDPQSLLDTAVLDKLAAGIDTQRATPWPAPASGGDTVWFGAVDADGRAVSVIQSTYFEFGSGVVLPQTGIVWQNRGASFRLKETGWNALSPGRKPFHTLNPAIARFDDGRVMAYGTMGGEGQPQTQAAIFSRYARFGAPLQQAITAPRWLLGKTWGEDSASLKLEDRFDPALYDALRGAGHEVQLLEPFTSVMGHAGALVRNPDGVIEGACDPRSDGAVAAR